MNNEHNNAVTVELGGRVYEIKLTHSVLKRISARLHLPMSRIDEMMDRYDFMSVAMEELILRVDPSLGLDEIGEMLDELPIMEIGRLVNDAFVAAFPHDEENEKADGADPFGTGTKA